MALLRSSLRFFFPIFLGILYLSDLDLDSGVGWNEVSRVGLNDFSGVGLNEFSGMFGWFPG